MPEKISTTDIVNILAKQYGISKQDATAFVVAFCNTVEDGLIADKILKINNIGTFKIETTKPRKSIDINSGKTIEIASHNRLSFTPAASLATAANTPLQHLTTYNLDEKEHTDTFTTTPPIQSPIIGTKPSNHTVTQPNKSTSITDINYTTTSNPTPQSNQPSEQLLKLSEEAANIQSLLFDIQNTSTPPETTLETSNDIFAETTQNTTTDAQIKISKSHNNNNTSKPITTTSETAPSTTPIHNNLQPQPRENISIEIQTLSSTTDTTTQTAYTTPLPNSHTTPIFEIQCNTNQKMDDKKEQTTDHLTVDGAAAVAAINRENDKEIRGSNAVWITTAIVLALLIIGIILWNNQEIFISKSSLDNPTTLGTTPQKSSTVYSHDGINTSPIIVDTTNITTETYTLSTDTTTIPTDYTTETQYQTSDHIINTTSSSTTQTQAQPTTDMFSQIRHYTHFIDTIKLQPGSRLTLISLKYYNHKDFWVYIYEANKDHIANPNNIEVGTTLYIPQLNPQLIDPNNPKCIENARKLHDKYVK